MLVVRDWTERQNVVVVPKLEGIISSMENFYLKPPFNRWWVTATGVPGVPPDSQNLESYNNDLQRSGVIKKGSSKEYFLATGLPEMLTFDGTFNQDLKMTLEPIGYASQFLSATYEIVTERKFMARVPRGTEDKHSKPYPEGTYLYFNAPGFSEGSFQTLGTKARLKDYEKGLLGETGGCTTVADFNQRFLCFNRVEKVAGSWHCNCKDLSQQKQCKDSIAAEDIDGKNSCGKKLETMPRNKPGAHLAHLCAAPLPVCATTNQRTLLCSWPAKELYFSTYPAT